MRELDSLDGRHIHDVAKQAGVSAGTASRALRGHPQVSEACIARVRAAAEKLCYTPLRDRSGRSRPEQRSRET
jgi:DNA-binding LacI/PurR family transcriptional regulator